jgi:hypothetical protein
VLLRLVLWNLADSKTTIDELRRYLRDESVDQFEEVPGLRFKAWISDEVTERPEAVYLWDSAEAARQGVAFRRRGDDRGRVRGRGALAAGSCVRALAGEP